MKSAFVRRILVVARRAGRGVVARWVLSREVRKVVEGVGKLAVWRAERIAGLEEEADIFGRVVCFVTRKEGCDVRWVSVRFGVVGRVLQAG